MKKIFGVIKNVFRRSTNKSTKTKIAFEVTTLVTHNGINKKFLKKYIVISSSIPSTLKDLNAGKNEEFLESRRLFCEVVIK
jgi:hypothetical protein